MTLLIVAFLAGVLTVAAPCILPLLPVIIGGSVVEAGRDSKNRSWLRPVVIALSLAVSVILFTLLIKASTSLLGVPQMVWQIISGGIVLSIGVFYLLPHAWEKLTLVTGEATKSNEALARASKNKGLLGSVLIGGALGPVFASCSPTYALIVATVLPVSFAQGLLYLVAYAAGLSVTLLLIAFAGQAAARRLRWLANPNGFFRRLIGVIFIIVGLAVIFGLDKAAQAYVLEQGWYDPISKFEESLR